MFMPDKNGQKYICFLPKEESEKPVFQHNISSMIVENKRELRQKTPDELLEGLTDMCIFMVSICISKFPSDN